MSHASDRRPRANLLHYMLLAEVMTGAVAYALCAPQALPSPGPDAPGEASLLSVRADADDEWAEPRPSLGLVLEANGRWYLPSETPVQIGSLMLGVAPPRLGERAYQVVVTGSMGPAQDVRIRVFLHDANGASLRNHDGTSRRVLRTRTTLAGVAGSATGSLDLDSTVCARDLHLAPLLGRRSAATASLTWVPAAPAAGSAAGPLVLHTPAPVADPQADPVAARATALRRTPAGMLLYTWGERYDLIAIRGRWSGRELEALTLELGGSEQPTVVPAAHLPWWSAFLDPEVGGSVDASPRGQSEELAAFFEGLRALARARGRTIVLTERGSAAGAFVIAAILEEADLPPALIVRPGRGAEFVSHLDPAVETLGLAQGTLSALDEASTGRLLSLGAEGLGRVLQDGRVQVHHARVDGTLAVSQHVATACPPAWVTPPSRPQVAYTPEMGAALAVAARITWSSAPFRYAADPALWSLRPL